jgi:hypothetical protein
MTARRLWCLYVVLLVLSVPWYFPAGTGEPIVLGLPLWCLASLACCIAAALVTIAGIDVLWLPHETVPLAAASNTPPPEASARPASSSGE